MNLFRRSCFGLLSLLVPYCCASAEPVTFLWQNGVVLATRPYFGSDFLPGTIRSVNSSGQVSGTLFSPASIRTAGTWDGQSLTSLGTPVGYGESFGNSINNAGSVAGASINGGTLSPTIWRNGVAVSLPLLPGATGGAADAINEINQTVGFSLLPQGPTATLWSNGSAQPLASFAGAGFSEAIDINGSGTAVGYSGSQAVTWTGGSVSALPGCSGASAAYALNDAGQAVGRCGSDGVLWANGQMIFTGGGLAQSIDNSGIVVGRTSDLPLLSQTYIWSAASGLQILPGFVWSQPFAISPENGYILGYGELAPEPSSALLLPAGLGLVVLWHKRRTASLVV